MMCGITGFIASLERSAAELSQRAEAMASTLNHRGPDDGAIWVDRDAGIALAHRRLAIVDPTASGRQPMISRSGRYVISCNGEIYNHLELRNGLQGSGAVFRGRSDTEVLLTAIDRLGLSATLERLDGMFAFALWDNELRALHLVRDRLGEKPLYFGTAARDIVFGSELSACRAHPDFDSTLDCGAIALLLRHGYIPAPFSVYASIRKVEPGTIVTLTRNQPPHVQVYWSFADVARRGLATRFRGSPDDKLDELASLVNRSVSRCCDADAPLGALLSGGVDSALVASTAQASETGSLQTFTLGFDDPRYDEIVPAAAIANYIGARHTAWRMTAADARRLIPRLPEIYDEPFADPSQIPSVLLAQYTSRHVTAALSGDGGDELFGGYGRYRQAAAVWRQISRIPDAMRGTVCNAAVHLGRCAPDRSLAALGRLVGGPAFARNSGDKLLKWSRAVSAPSPEAFYQGLMSHWSTPPLTDAQEPDTILSDQSRHLEHADFETRMMFIDTLSYLPDGVLVKMDRASMAAGLEVRAPLLDRHVVEFAWRMPQDWKIRDDVGKWPLRALLQRRLPKALFDKPKMGFGVPLDVWLRGPLKAWANDLLDPAQMELDGLLDAAPIRKRWQEHLAGTHDWQFALWNVLMLRAWQEHQRTSTPVIARSPLSVPPAVEVAS